MLALYTSSATGAAVEFQHDGRSRTQNTKTTGAINKSAQQGCECDAVREKAVDGWLVGPFEGIADTEPACADKSKRIAPPPWRRQRASRSHKTKVRRMQCGAYSSAGSHRQPRATHALGATTALCEAARADTCWAGRALPLNKSLPVAAKTRRRAARKGNQNSEHLIRTLAQRASATRAIAHAGLSL